VLSSLFCTVGILAAINVREKTGEGQMVDVSLVDSVYAALENIPQKYFAEGIVPGRIGNRYEFIYPYDTFRARDGWVVIGIANDVIWARFIEVSGLKSIGVDPRFASNPLRVENHAALREELEKWTSARTRDDIVGLLNDSRVPSCPIYDVRDVSEDPHVAVARGMVVEVDQPGLGKVRLQGNPVKMSATDPKPRGPAPALGGDTDQILGELGFGEEEIGRFRKSGAI
jgi:formyl-CoA transferase